MKYTPKGHYELGYGEVFHRNKPTVTSTVSREANIALSNLIHTFDFEVAYIPVGYEHRPDLISDLFYDSPKNDWLIMLFNNVEDPFEGLNVGDKILLPKM